MDAGFAEADVILEHTFHTAITIMPLWSRNAVSPAFRDGAWKSMSARRSRIPTATKLPVPWAGRRSSVRVIGQLMGGGFGGKEDIAGQIHAALLANVTGRPVKLLFDRHESLLVHPKRHATQIRVKIGAKNDGRLTAVETRTVWRYRRLCLAG